MLAGAVTLQAGLGIVTLLHQAPASAGACAPGAGNCGISAMAVVHAERLSHRAVHRPRIKAGGAGRMIEVKIDDGIAVLTMTHGKANALDIEFCDALAARFDGVAQGPMPRRWC